jgi:hypothetical protein
MMLRPAQLVISGLLAAAVLGGCGPEAVDIDNPITVATDEYDRVFEASVEVLRDHRFVVNRQDRRFGLVSTHPRIASSVFEPWYDDNTTFDQAGANTINHQRRTAFVRIEPAGTPRLQDDPVELLAFPTWSDEYQLRVEVLVERRQLPDRQLTTAAVTGTLYPRYAGSRERGVVTERGYEDSHWRPVGRDELLERRLVFDILSRAELTVPGFEAGVERGIEEPAEQPLRERPDEPAPPPSSPPDADEPDKPRPDSDGPSLERPDTEEKDDERGLLVD